MVPSVNLPTVPSLWEGKQFVDDRGSVSFVNEFNPYKCGVERFYTVRNVRSQYIRAWHGHKREGKFAMVTSGMALVCVVRIAAAQKWVENDVPCEYESFILCGWQPKVLWIPPGYYNGFKSLKEGTDIMFFSTSSLEDSKGDDYRLDWDALGTKMWNEHFR